MNTRRRRVGLLLLLLVICLVAAASETMARRGGAFDQLDLMVDVRHEIVSQYVEEPNQEKMAESGVRAMIESLDDPYTTYISPEEIDPFDKQVRGTFSGIGAEVEIHEGRPRIVSPLDDSPAWRGGIMAGDIVLEIDGNSTEGLTISEVIKRLTGTEGTQVSLKVRHLSGEEAPVTITRAQINVQTVRGVHRRKDRQWDFMLDPANKVGYIRVSQFTEKTASGVRAALDQLLVDGVRGVILDLRFDGGGLLESAIEISDMFLGAGKRIVSVKGRVVPERVIHATGPGTIPDVPMVVVANEFSASASEVVTGALADNGRAKFIGTRTYGKGSVQQVHMLENGRGAIKITNAYYYLPNGRNIHRRKDKDVWGVDPDDGFYVPMTPEQITAMVKIRREGDVLRKVEAETQPEAWTPERVEKEFADPQLGAALKAIVGKIQGGEWPVVGQSGAAEIAKLTKRANLERQRSFIVDRLAEVDAEMAKLNVATTQPAATRAAPVVPQTQPAAQADPQPHTTIEDVINSDPSEPVDAPAPAAAQP